MRFNPILGSDLSGHVGGLVASHNTYGVYFKRRAHPANPKSPGQIAQRTSLQIVSQTWRAQSAAQRLAWATAAVVKTSRKGFVVTLSGQAAWMHVNLLRQRIGLPLITVPLTTDDAATFTLPAVTLTAPTALSVTYIASVAGELWNDTGGGVIVSATGPLSPGVSYAQAFRTVGVTPGATATPEVYALPFSVVAGQRVRLRFHVTDPQGRMSVPADLDVVSV
jgi:hypothetical protein